ncbi:hypothetical protein [Paraferrimonas sedimenticola]|uniref:Phage shock protein B n=1 Tax=Paraferrimonas sedimenticola TaxID=375674 RepID=A0AA37RNX0_9GAMM|nr:hypothetical protein [Paraferrimonas sedimenticola]GLP94816.1 hypothetical protein GCM10007895_01220 [Paraferrimonas sedimenticola]
MNPAILSLLIPLIAIGGGLMLTAYRSHLKHQKELAMHSAEIQGKASERQVSQMELEIEKLKQRVATLEAIVTDNTYQLRKDINELS